MLLTKEKVPPDYRDRVLLVTNRDKIYLKKESVVTSTKYRNI